MGALMKRCNIFAVCCFLLNGFSVLADGMDYIASEFFTPALLTQISKETESALKESGMLQESALDLIGMAKDRDSRLANILAKRLEIAMRLKADIEALQKQNSEAKILAWQWSKELTVMAEYFRQEKKRFEEKRTMPPPMMLSVKDFGAAGDGKQDDGPAFRKAFAAAERAAKPVVLKIPSGIYKIMPEKTSLPVSLAVNMADIPAGGSRMLPGRIARAHLLVRNMKHFSIQGETNSRLCFTDATMLGIRFIGCRDSGMKNIFITYTENPSTQGKITAVSSSPRFAVVKIDDNFPAPDEKRFLEAPSRRFSPRMPGKLELYGSGTGRLGKVERIDANNFRLYALKHEQNHYAWKNLKPGDRISIIARFDPIRYDASAVDFRYCAFGHLENVVVYQSPGCGFRLFRNYAAMLSGCKILPEENTGDYVSSNADGSQCSGAIGPYVENCCFSNMEDDAFNLTSPSAELRSVSTDRKRSVPYAACGALVISGISGKCKAVLIPSLKNPGQYLLPLPADCISSENIRKLTVKERLEADYYGANAAKFQNRPDRLVLMPSDLSGTVIVNSRFNNIRGLALQITAPNVLVENCRISNMTGYGCNVNIMLPWGMLFNVHNVVIRNCHFSGNRAPDISLDYRGLKHGDTLEPRPIRNIQVLDCTFEQSAWCSVEVKNADGVLLKNNTFITSNKKWFSVYCNNFRNVKVTDCRFKINSAAKAIFCKNPAEAKYAGQTNNKITPFHGRP